MAEWTRDDGYSGCKTARFGEVAVVLCPPEYEGGWGYQAFDESDDDPEIMSEDYGFASERAVVEFVEGCMEGAVA